MLPPASSENTEQTVLGPQRTDAERLDWIQRNHRTPWICDRAPSGRYDPPRFSVVGYKAFLSVRDAIDHAMDAEDRQRQTEGATEHAGGNAA